MKYITIIILLINGFIQGQQKIYHIEPVKYPPCTSDLNIKVSPDTLFLNKNNLYEPVNISITILNNADTAITLFKPDYYKYCDGPTITTDGKYCFDQGISFVIFDEMDSVLNQKGHHASYALNYDAPKSDDKIDQFKDHINKRLEATKEIIYALEEEISYMDSVTKSKFNEAQNIILGSGETFTFSYSIPINEKGEGPGYSYEDYYDFDYNKKYHIVFYYSNESIGFLKASILEYCCYSNAVHLVFN